MIKQFLESIPFQILNLHYNSDPSDGGYVGWVYTQDNDWRRFGNVSLSSSSDEYIFDKIGIGTTSPGLNTLQISSGSSLVAIDGDGIGIGTTANGYKLRIEGNARFDGKIADNDGNFGTAGQIIQSTGTGVEWVTSGELNGWERTAATYCYWFRSK